MRGKSCSMDGLGEVPDFDARSSFYVPGERHENLPAGGFAGPRSMGTPVYSIRADDRAPEYATGGSGMFQGQADFGHGKLIATTHARRGYGQEDDSEDDSPGFFDMLSQGLSTVSDVASALGPAQAQASTQVAPSYASRITSSAPAKMASGIMSKKIAGVPVVAVVALAGVAAFFLIKKKRRA